jgi:hypothetical protein
MRTRRLALITLGIATVVAGSVAAYRVSRPPVTVILTNASTKTIVSVRLEHERGVEVAEDLARGAAKTMRFKARGETSYRLRVRFQNSPAAVDTPRRVTSSPKWLVTQPSRPTCACQRATDAVQRHATVDRQLD